MKKLILGSILLASCFSFAEDIELYVGNATQRVGNKPKLLIIFDNSGSMNTVQTVKDPYDPDEPYPAIGGYNSLSDKFIYFTKGVGVDGVIPIPDSPSEQRRFLDEINGCAIAKERLDTVGFYTGYIREYRFRGQSGSWQEIPDNNGADIQVVDCMDDITQKRSDNALLGSDDVFENGYPINGLGTSRNPIYYTPGEDGDAGDAAIALSNASQIGFGQGQLVTLYRDNYLRWNQAPSEDIGEVELSRLTIAKNTISNLIESTPSVDFGMQIFNHNHSGEFTRDGGRVIFGIQNMDFDARQNLIDLVQDEVDAETNTPLCETLYEAAQYFGGKPVKFGDDDSDRDRSYVGNTPPRDTSIENGGSYLTPFDGCTKELYVLMITDGAPTRDLAADALITPLDGVGSSFSVNGTGNYLAELAGWMRTHDLITGEAAVDGDLTTIRNSLLSTVGFGLVDPADAEDPDYVEPDAVKLLKEAALKGGGSYYAANDPDSLLLSMQEAIYNILEVSGTFTPPAVSTNNFDRTETLDSVYYAMFTPDRGPRWPGNLKKLKVTGGGILDRANNQAIDADGNIIDTAQTYWSTGPADGGEVEQGGVAQMLRLKTNRVFLSNLNGSGPLTQFTRSDAESFYGSSTLLATGLDVIESEIDNTLAWAKGIDVDDEDKDTLTTDIRKDVFGDPLHSKPIVINYGGLSEADQDIRVIVGTNTGILHMFDDNGDTVDETWAFMPEEFFSNISALRESSTSTNKVYGIDGSVSSYIYDANNDGVINGSDKAWIFFGLRRGGDSYYAIDVSNPSAPSLMWKIDSSTAGFSELGQTWSQPKVTFSKINMSGNNAKPVLVFGAGYSTGKDSAGVGTADYSGRGMYMLDAETGNILWSLTPDTTPAFPGTDSIPSKIEVLDSDSDGLIDRLYAGDTGGNVWRVDMPGIATSDWTVVKLASLGSDAAGDNANDRRFFNQPTVVRALITQTLETTVIEDGVSTVTIDRYDKPYDAVLLGSGDISNPLGSDTNDMFFMIKDENVITQSLTGALVPDIITLPDLKDYTLNPFEGLLEDSAELLAQQLDASEKSGWFISLNTDPGEKSMSPALVLSGVVFFTSYTPAASAADEESCSAQVGGSALYAVDLALGINLYDWRRITTSLNPVTDITIVTVPPEPPCEGEDCEPPCEGEGCEEEDESDGPIRLLVPTLLKPPASDFETIRTHLYIDENQ